MLNYISKLTDRIHPDCDRFFSLSMIHDHYVIQYYWIFTIHSYLTYCQFVVISDIIMHDSLIVMLLLN